MAYLPTWMAPWGPMSFASMTAISMIDRSDPNLLKNLILAIFQVDIGVKWPYNFFKKSNLDTCYFICSNTYPIKRVLQHRHSIFSLYQPIFKFLNESISSLTSPSLLINTKIFDCLSYLFTFFSAISKLIGIPFGTKLLFAPGNILKQ